MPSMGRKDEIDDWIAAFDLALQEDYLNPERLPIPCSDIFGIAQPAWMS